MTKHWVLRDQKPGFDYEVYRDFNIGPLIAKIVHNRGIVAYDMIDAYLNPSISNIHNPNLLPNIDEAADRLDFAIKNKEKILLFGDYDVDGITGSSILYRALYELGANVEAYIPNRFTDGYGISSGPLDRIFKKEDKAPGVVISIDNGIVAFDAANYLREKGSTFIVADHHRMMEDGTLPEGILVHPGIPGSKYPNKDLCGAGVAFKLAWGVAQKVNNTDKLPAQYRDLFTELTALVAMGTIADIMPLTNENRQLVAFGLKQMRKTDFVGVKALVEASVRDPDAPLKAGQVSFHVAPRINAAGRLGSGQKAFDLLTSDLNFESIELTEALGRDNELRKEIEADIVDKAFNQVIDIYGDKPLMAGLVAVDEDWHEGVVGIVASRVVERFHRPSIVLSILEDGINVKGSGRSALGIDMKDALDECGDLLDKYGGHGAAVGLSMKREHLDEFRERFAMACAKQLGYDTPELTDVFEELKIDADLPIKDITFDFMRELMRLEPCGMGNKRPLFSSTVKLAGEPTLMGKIIKSHLSFNIEQGGKVLRCIMWKRADLFPELKRFSELPMTKPFRIAFKPDINEFRGRKHIQLIVSELLLPKEEEEEE